MEAAKTGNVEIVRKLIHHGASVNLTNKVNHNSFRNVYTVTSTLQSFILAEALKICFWALSDRIERAV